mmetsp:Transcript_3556/g.6894  ORF Transcript_3556/g.6894 Transcript_3556/m.6894 type:complete len:288 (+) Transcript_3556:2524-3387(+)
MKQLWVSFGCGRGKYSFPLNVRCSAELSLSSCAWGLRPSESIIPRMPICNPGVLVFSFDLSFFELVFPPCSNATHSILSGGSCLSFSSTSSPSFSYSCASAWKICWLKQLCSASFVKLMSSCSKSFILKVSNPKISSTPIKGRSSREPFSDKETVTHFTSQSKRPMYTNLTTASRANFAPLASRFFTTSSPTVFTRCSVNTLSSFDALRPRSLAAISSGSWSFTVATFPSELSFSTNLTFPRCKMAATTSKTPPLASLGSFSALAPIVPSALQSSLKSALSTSGPGK